MGLIQYNTKEYTPTSFRSFVDQFFNDESMGGSTPTFRPRVDISETEAEFEVQLHAPGMKKEDFKIDLDKDQLIISGERQLEKKTSEKNFHSLESYYGTFKRSFHLPEVINHHKIEASYTDGILSITLPKDEKKVAKKQIAVS